MSEITSKKRHRRIELQITDADDDWSDYPENKVISLKYSQVDDDKQEQFKRRKSLKRKCNEKGKTASGWSTTKGRSVGRSDKTGTPDFHPPLHTKGIGTTNRIKLKDKAEEIVVVSTVKRFKAPPPKQETTTIQRRQSVQKDTKKKIAGLKEVKSPLKELENEKLLREDKKTKKLDLSKSYRDMSDAVKKLTESISLSGKLRNIKDNSTTKECKARSKDVSSSEPKISSTVKQTETNGVVGNDDILEIGKNPLREFRLHKNKDNPTQSTTSQMQTVEKNEKSPEPSPSTLQIQDVDRRVINVQIPDDVKCANQTINDDSCNTSLPIPNDIPCSAKPTHTSLLITGEKRCTIVESHSSLQIPDEIPNKTITDETQCTTESTHKPVSVTGETKGTTELSRLPCTIRGKNKLSHTSMKTTDDSNNATEVLNTLLHIQDEFNKTEPLHISKQIPNDTTLKQPTYGENIQNEISDTSLQMIDDAINVKIAAEALNLLKYNGRTNFHPRQEYIQTVPQTCEKISDADSCAASFNCVENKPLNLSSTPVIAPYDTRTFEKQPNKKRLIFDSTLEITDVVTGIKIPLESFYLTNENDENTKIEYRLKQKDGWDSETQVRPDPLLQLADTVTCVKVPLPATISNRTKQLDESSARTSKVILPDKSMQMSNDSKIQLGPVSVPRNGHVAKQQSELGYATLQNLGIDETRKPNLSAECGQLLDASMYTSMVMPLLNVPNNDAIAQQQIQSRYADSQQNITGSRFDSRLPRLLQQISNTSTCVKIPLESVHLPKYAATGVKIPLEAINLSRNENKPINGIDYRPINTNQNPEDTNYGTGFCKQYDKTTVDAGVNEAIETLNLLRNQNGIKRSNILQPKYSEPNITRNINFPTPLFVSKEQLDCIQNAHTLLPTSDAIKCVKLPLEHRLHINKTAIKQNALPEEMKEIKNYHTPSQISDEVQGSKCILAPPRLVINNGNGRFRTNDRPNLQWQEIETTKKRELAPAVMSSILFPPLATPKYNVELSAARRCHRYLSIDDRTMGTTNVQPPTIPETVRPPLSYASSEMSTILFPPLAAPKYTVGQSAARRNSRLHSIDDSTIGTTNAQRSAISAPIKPELCFKSGHISSIIFSPMETPKCAVNQRAARRSCRFFSTDDRSMLRTNVQPQEVRQVIKPVVFYASRQTSDITENAQQWQEGRVKQQKCSPSYPQPPTLITNDIVATGPTHPHQQTIEDQGMPKLPHTYQEASDITETITLDALNFNSSDVNRKEPPTFKIVPEENVNTGLPPNQMSASVKTAKTPLEAFTLFINDNMLQRILKHTNVTIAKLSLKTSRNCFKKSSNERELKAFLGVLLISGALKQNTISVPEIWSECFGAGIYRATFHEPRFHILLKSICFGDSTSRDKCIFKDEFTRIGDLWGEYLNNCKQYSLRLQNTKEMTDISTNETDDTGEDEPGHVYSTARKTVNMPLRILCTMLDGAGVNGLAVYRRENPTEKISQREFLKQVGMSLIRPHLRSRMLKPTLRKPIRELIESILNKKNDDDDELVGSLTPPCNSLNEEKRCHLCAWNNDVKTEYQCERCKKAMCSGHRTNLCVVCVKKDLM